MTDVRELVKDPLFQLNLLLWQSIPVKRSLTHRSIFHESGFCLHSIAPKLALPLTMRVNLGSTSVPHNPSASPDLILKNDALNKYLLTEAKASSFGPNTDQAHQAGTLLMMCGQAFRDALALNPDEEITSSLMYVTVDERKEPLHRTLEVLKKKIEDNKTEANMFCCLGLKGGGNNSISLVIDDECRRELRFSETGDIEVIKGEMDTDPRPLYLIPYDPSLEHDDYSQKAFRQRIRVEVLSAVGRARVGRRMVFNPDEILNRATFGMYRFWGETDTRRNLRKKVKGYIAHLAEQSEGMILKEHGEWSLEPRNSEEKDHLLSKLRKAIWNEADDSQSTLFDFYSDRE